MSSLAERENVHEVDLPNHPLKNILVPTDFSDSSDTALHIAIDLARQQGARIFLLHVTDSGNLADKLLRMQSQIDAFGEAKSIDILPEIRKGKVYKQIMKMQSGKNIDMIVIPGHFKTGSVLDRFRNITAKIKRTAPCSVLVVGV